MEHSTDANESGRQAAAAAHFQVGADYVSSGDVDQCDAADEEFEAAVRLGGSSWAWLAADEYLYASVAANFGRWMARGIVLDFPLAIAPAITVSPDTFAPMTDGSRINRINVHLKVETDQLQEARAALAACEGRLMRVDQNGREWETFEALIEAMHEGPLDRNGDELYNPADVSRPILLGGGVGISIDTDGQVWGPMARSILRVIIEELHAAGVAAAHIRAFRY
ncbi:hypothetical protein [Kineosporia sp. NBRC 101731]|uniref:hypothetical protein n=1 Tax=Kineosporia sp. NBRC 101731 TaxID=3032199 RepID=UPI002557908A|nr:hypothetical protein [Kineosporia sp. NBRC 101731]